MVLVSDDTGNAQKLPVRRAQNVLADIRMRLDDVKFLIREFSRFI